MTVTQRYRLVKTIASGGMAQVLEAAVQGMDGFERRVAIKRLLPQHLRDGGRRRMFFDEASIGSRLHHGGVVQIFDYGLIDNAAFLAMEFVDGMDALRAVVLSGDGRSMPEEIALHVISEVAHALAYIHDVKDELGEPLGIVHRDVSPQNILLSWDGDVKLSDFGIALSLQREESTAEGVVKGKLPYMPPEQALGKRVDSAADVYALGATLAMLLGVRASGPAMTDDEVWARVTAARELGVSAPVAELIGACTCREPSARLKAADVAAAAGSLATQKLSRCARGSLRDWLAPLRPREQEGSALDDLMGLCLVPVGNDGGRTFTVSQMLPPMVDPLAALDPLDARGARTSAPIEVQTPLPIPLSRAQRMARITRWAATAAAVVVAAAFTVPRPRRHDAHVAGAVAAPAPVAFVAPSAAPGAEGSGAMRTVVAMTPTPSSRHARRSMALGVRGGVEESGLAHGWVRVGGTGLLGGQVTVDGAPIGFAPLERALPVGQHAVAVVSPISGQTLLRQTIHVGGHHTHVRPLRLLR